MGPGSPRVPVVHVAVVCAILGRVGQLSRRSVQCTTLSRPSRRFFLRALTRPLIDRRELTERLTDSGGVPTGETYSPSQSGTLPRKSWEPRFARATRLTRQPGTSGGDDPLRSRVVYSLGPHENHSPSCTGCRRAVSHSDEL